MWVSYNRGGAVYLAKDLFSPMNSGQRTLSRRDSSGKRTISEGETERKRMWSDELDRLNIRRSRRTTLLLCNIG